MAYKTARQKPEQFWNRPLIVPEKPPPDQTSKGFGYTMRTNVLRGAQTSLKQV